MPTPSTLPGRYTRHPTTNTPPGTKPPNHNQNSETNLAGKTPNLKPTNPPVRCVPDVSQMGGPSSRLAARLGRPICSPGDTPPGVGLVAARRRRLRRASPQGTSPSGVRLAAHSCRCRVLLRGSGPVRSSARAVGPPGSPSGSPRVAHRAQTGTGLALGGSTRSGLCGATQGVAGSLRSAGAVSPSGVVTVGRAGCRVGFYKGGLAVARWKRPVAAGGPHGMTSWDGPIGVTQRVGALTRSAHQAGRGHP